MLTVLYLDDQLFCLKFVESLLIRHEQIELITTLNINDVWNYLAQSEQPIDILVLDIEMDVNGVKLAQAINIIYPEQKIVFFSSRFDLYNLDTTEILNLPCTYGCLPKSISEADLVKAIYDIGNNQKVFKFKNTVKENKQAKLEPVELITKKPALLAIPNQKEIGQNKKIDTAIIAESVVTEIIAKLSFKSRRNNFLLLFIIGLIISQIIQIILLIIIIIIK